jgi:hypothetical protein
MDRLGVVALLLLVLAGCGSQPGAPRAQHATIPRPPLLFPSTTPQFDGAWRGRLYTALPDTLGSETMNLTIGDGFISGDLLGVPLAGTLDSIWHDDTFYHCRFQVTLPESLAIMVSGHLHRYYIYGGYADRMWSNWDDTFHMIGAQTFPAYYWACNDCTP